jgi:CMP-N-acetylneuraminic acid synthetase
MITTRHSEPKVTVYIASHNYGRFLSEAIESVLRQQFDSWELLLIDDGSSDDSRNIMSLYSSDPRVRIFEQTGIGLPRVANLALKEARGEFLIRLDGDDIFDENILFVLANYLDRYKDVALVFPDYYLIDEGGEVFSHERRLKVSESTHLKDMPPHGACTLIRRAILLSIGGYREDLGAQDGFDLWSKIRNSHRIMNVNLPLFYYRRHGTNLTNSSYRILSARRQITRDSIGLNFVSFRPILAVIPCRSRYDFQPNLWSIELNGKTLLQRKLEMCAQSKLFDRIIVASDTEQVKEIIQKVDDSRIEYFERDVSETLRSRSIVGTLTKISEFYDPEFRGITVLCYLPSPFVTLSSLEEAVNTLVFNDADSSMGVEELKDPILRRTPYGLKLINGVNGFKTEHDVVYREASIALATKNKNFRTGSLVGPSLINFVVTPEESFFIDSNSKLQCASILDSQQ